MNDRAPADAIHRSTKHGTAPAEPDRLVPFPRLDPANSPAPFKRYPDLPGGSLSRTIVESALPAVTVLSGGRGEPSPLDEAFLATVLYLTAGVTRAAARPDGLHTYFRAAMAAGNLHPVEVYVVSGPDVDGIERGVHHFAPLEFGLTTLRSGDYRAVVPTGAPVALILTGIVWRTAWKYAERGWRHLYWDAGTMLANLLAVADANGIDVGVFAGFDDRAVSRLVGIDGIDEVPLVVVTLGENGVAPPPVSELPQLSPAVVPIAPRPIRLPLVVDAQKGSALGAPEVQRWRSAAAAVGAPAPTSVEPPPLAPSEPIEAVVLRRGSTRAMVPEVASVDALRWPMAAATRATQIDGTGGGTLLEHHLSVHGIESLRPGAYRWLATDVELIAGDDDARRAGSLLALNQPLGGDSTYTVFHAARLGPILDALGARGYRVAQLEAGIVSGRLALCAFSLGLGATGLTFLDDLVSDHFHTTAAPMLATAVGVPVSAPAPSGTPGEPVALGR